MQWTIPGTVLTAQTEDAEKIRDVFNAFFLAGNISLSQVSACLLYTSPSPRDA